MALRSIEQEKGYLSLMDGVVDPNANSGAGAVVRRYTKRAMNTGNPDISPAAEPYSGSPILSRPKGPRPVNERAIREDTRRRMQASIDAIDANYANLISQEKVQGQDRAGQTRAMNARGGLMGSDFGVAQQEKTTRYNAQQEKVLADQQNAQIAAVVQNIEDRANTEIANKKTEAEAGYQRDMAAYNEARDQARSDLKILADSGVDIATLNPAQKTALFKQAGYENSAFGELIYNALKPKPKQIDYQSVNVGGGRVLFYGVDPVTGELKQQMVDVGLPDEWTMTIAPDGTALAFNKNTGATQMLSEQGQFIKPETVDPLDQLLKQAQIEKIYSDIANGKGSEPLSANDAKLLGVPYGTTKEEAGKLGIIPTAPLSAEAQKLQANVKSGQRALETIKKELFDENGGVRKSLILRGSLGGAREFTSALREIKDVLVRLRTGAAISENEEEYYESQLPNSVLDNEATIKSKLKRFEDLFNDLTQRAQSMESSPEDLFNEFEGGSEGTNPKAPLGQVGIKTLASAVMKKFPDGGIGGQCGDFVRKVANSLGLDYARLGDSLKTKMSVVQKYGTSLANAGAGSVIVTKENPTYGHVAFIMGRNAQGYIVAESNFKQSNKISYGRVIPYNSDKIVGVINPTRTS